jgi:hypothetical protein
MAVRKKILCQSTNQQKRMTAWRILQRHFYQMQRWMHIPHPSDFCKQKKTQPGKGLGLSHRADGLPGGNSRGVNSPHPEGRSKLVMGLCDTQQVRNRRTGITHAICSR